MPTPPSPVLRVRILCLRPPDPAASGAEFGLQERTKDPTWKLHPGRREADGNVVFEGEIQVRNTDRSQRPDFFGPLVHGKPGERFLYLSWRPNHWNPWQPEPPGPAWVRRMKIHLRSLDWPTIDAASTPGRFLQATVAGTAKDGGPNCASVELLEGGWRVI